MRLTSKSAPGEDQEKEKDDKGNKNESVLGKSEKKRTKDNADLYS